MSYVSLNNHTCYSITRALPDPSELLQKIKDLGQPAVAITDSGTLAGVWKAYKAAKEIDVKLIIGCEFYFIDDVSVDQKLRQIVLLAKNHQGYKNLLLLNKIANDNLLIGSRHNYPRIDWKIISEHHDGLICLTGGAGGILGQLICTRQIDKAKEECLKLKNIFGNDLGLEIQPNTLSKLANNYSDYMDQRLVNNQLIKFSKEFDIKIIPTTNSFFLNKEDHEMHDVMLCVGSGQPIKIGNRPKYTEDFYCKSEDEVRTFFGRLYPNEVDQWINNTIEFSDRCEIPDWIDPKYTNPSGKELPEFPVKDQDDYEIFLQWKQNPIYPCSSEEEDQKIKSLDEESAYYRYWVYKNFARKVPLEKEKEYHNRLVNEEFDVLEYHGFPGYMLIVADILDFCRKNKYPIGPGRGSVGACLSAYLTDIHQADPIQYDLIFARFHNKEKSSFPDIDMDISPKYRHNVQNYIVKKYDIDKVAHVCNINTITPKVYVRDVARAFQFGGGREQAVEIGNMLADHIPKEYHSIEQALKELPIFAELVNTKYPEIAKFTGLIGKPRAIATHAAGLVISKRPLHEIVPIRKDADGNISLELDKDQTEEVGLVKMDTLGLETLDIIYKTYELINEKRDEKLNPEEFNYNGNDLKAYELISNGKTLGLFQLGGSGGTTELCVQVKPKNVWDVALINALARPSAKDLRQGFVDTRNGKKKIKFPHPSVTRAFTKTFGLFEECLMFLAADVAGWDLHSADRLRKLTKEKGKNPKKVAKWKEEFIADAQKNKQIAPEISGKIWTDIIEKFQGYGFNMPHATTYSMISYHTAWLKAYYPLEFLTANLISKSESNALDADDDILAFKTEIRSLGVKIIPPEINKAEMTYKILDHQTLLTGLNSMKYMGKDAMPEILAHRPYVSFEDFLGKIDGKKVRAPAVSALAAVGALDSFKLSRKQMFLYASDYKKKVQLWQKRANPGEFKYPWPENIGDWTIPEKFALEKYYLGEGLTGTFFQIYPGFFATNCIKFKELENHFDPEMSKLEKRIMPSLGQLQGVIMEIREFLIKKEDSKLKGQQMCHLSIQDPYGNIMKGTLFPDSLKYAKEFIKQLYGTKIKLEPGTAVTFTASVDWYQGEMALIIDSFKRCAPAPEKPAELKAQKVAMRMTKIKGKVATEPEEILEEMEDEMEENGLSENDE